MKFRLVFETTTKKGKKVLIKYKVPPSKHLGLINFLKIAMEDGNEVSFAVEKISEDKKELSKIRGNFFLTEEKNTESKQIKKK
jgi:hypothetical protein